MPTVFDVAKYILEQTGSMSSMKLQKLCYYSQAWSLVWDEEPLFQEEIQAWANGPVVSDLYDSHRGQFSVSVATFSSGDSANLSPDQKETIDEVIRFYGSFNPQQLSDLTHLEQPWRKAREGIPDGERSKSVISHAKMAEYYSSISPPNS